MKLDEITRMQQLAGINESAKYEVTLAESKIALKEGEFYFTGKSKEDGSPKIWKFGDMSFENAKAMAEKFGTEVKFQTQPGGTADRRHKNFGRPDGEEDRRSGNQF